MSLLAFLLSAAAVVGTLPSTPDATALIYHQVKTPPAGTANPDHYIAPARFDAHMRAIQGRTDVLVTIDGAYADAMKAAEILDRYGIKAIFFIAPARIGNPGRLTWAQVRDLHARGHVIGNLTMAHRVVVGMTPEQLDYQIGGAQARLAKQGVASPFFAYPMGEWDQPAIDYLETHGFVAAWSVDEGVAGNPYAIPRLKPGWAMTAAQLLAALH